MSEPESPRKAAEREALARAVEDSPLKGKLLPQRIRLARETIERYLAAARGPFAYMRRLRRIEDETERHARELHALWVETAIESPDDFPGRWRATAEAWDFTAVNELIEKHNAYYPIEANLPMDPRTGDFKRVKGRTYRLDPLDAGWVFEQFPPDITRVPEPPPAT